MNEHNASESSGKSEIKEGQWDLGNSAKTEKTQRIIMFKFKFSMILCTYYTAETVLGNGGKRRMKSNPLLNVPLAR